ncbi:hypothetical protein C1646_684507, partial [Rhizophagus diaphanus]
PSFSITSFHFPLSLFLSYLIPIISFCLSSLIFISHHSFSSSHHFFLSPITPFFFLFPINSHYSFLLPFIFYYFPYSIVI